MPTTCVLGQPFSANYNPSYHDGGLVGHTGVDEHCGYGTPVHALYDGIAYKVLTPEHPAWDGSGFTGVFQLVDDGIECFEWLTGHLTPSITAGTPLHKAHDGIAGDVMGTEANHGLVYSGNRVITLADQKAGNHEAAHRHYQKRPLLPVASTTSGPEYITGMAGSAYRQDGFYFKAWDYDNGFNGCVNPLKPVFYRDLTIGSQGYDVYVLQRILFRKGFLTAQPTGGFYMQTATAVAKYQSYVMGITPTSYFGPLSRSYALRELSPLPVLSGQ